MEQRAPLSFGAALKRHRRNANLTQEQLAEQAGYSVSYISMLERGERVPVHATVELLADALGLTAGEQSAFELAARERDLLNSVPDPPRFSRLVAASPPLAGRVAELARLDRHLAGDGPPLLLLSGEPGIGKSRLLAEAKRRADASAWTNLSGAAQRGSSRQPYTPLLEAIEQHVSALPSEALRRVLADAPWLTRLLPELADAPPQTSWILPPEQERRLIFTAVARYLAHIGTHAGTLLILDNLQWAGADALDLLASLVRSPSSAHLRVIGAYRESESDSSTPLGGFLADMAAAGLVTHLSLGPLVPDEASALIRDTLPTEHADGATIERIVARGAGVPFFLVSFAQSLTSNEPNASATVHDVPWDIVQTIRHRVSALPVESHELLEIAAVCGSEASRAVLHSASREIADEDASAVALDAACHARLLTERSDDHYAFSHELARDVVLHEIGPARRALLHLRIAEALETAAGERLAEQLAYHFARGGDAKRAIPYLAQAAARARAMQAYAAAASRYGELAESLDNFARPREAAAARERLGEVLTVAGQYRDAVDALESAARGFNVAGEPADVDRVAALIGLAYAASGEAVTGIDRLEALATSERATPVAPKEHAELWDALAQLYNVGGRYADQLRATVRAANLARETGDSRLRAQIQIRHGNALRMLGSMGEATAILEEAIQLSAAASDDQNLAFALENVSVVFLLQGKLHQSSAYVQRALELSQRLGDPIVLALMTLRRGMTAYALGSWDAAMVDYESAEARMRELGVAWVSAYTMIGLGQLHLARGEAASGSRLLEGAVDLSNHSGDLQAMRWAQTALAELDILEDRPGSARHRLEPLLDRPGQQEGLVTYLLPYLAWACARMDDDDAAQKYLQMCVERAEAEQIHLTLVDALRVRALLALDGVYAHSAEAKKDLQRAIELSSAMPYPYAEAKARYALGLLCRARGDVDSASSQWENASEILRHLGERLYASRVEGAQASGGS